MKGERGGVQLLEPKISTAALGFGCSSLASVGRKEALRLLGCAFDAGIRHFDVARCYGYGEAEGILGAFLKSRRTQVTVTTKFGIDPARCTSAVRLVLRVGRQALRLVPSVRNAAHRRASSLLVKTNAFSAVAAQRSLETSLRHLGTDYIDFDLLHDYVPGSDPSLSHELVTFLQQAVLDGKIRYFGLGTNINSVIRGLETEPSLCRVLQFPNSVLIRNRERLFGRFLPPTLVITHGALGEAHRCLSSFLRANNKAKVWSGELDVDCADERTLAALLLNYAVKANPDGLVLFSARSFDRIQHNVKSVMEPQLTPSQIETFAQFVERDLLSPRAQYSPHRERNI